MSNHAAKLVIFVFVFLFIVQVAQAFNATTNETSIYCEKETDCESNCCQDNKCCAKLEPVSYLVALTFVLLLCIGCFMIVGGIAGGLHFWSKKKNKRLQNPRYRQSITYDPTEPNVLILPSEMTIMGLGKQNNTTRINDLNSIFNNNNESDLEASSKTPFVKQVNFPSDVTKKNVEIKQASSEGNKS